MPPFEASQALPIVTGDNTGAKGVRVFIGPTDPISDIPITLDLAHHQLHEGESHQITIAPAALAINTSIDLRLVVGNLAPTTRTPHLTIEADATTEAWLYLYETPTTTVDGTPQTAYNRNRNSATVPNMQAYLGPTVTAVGTLLSAWIIGSGTRGGGATRDALEWDLKANTVYLVRLTAKAASCNAALRCQWYEDLGV